MAKVVGNINFVITSPLITVSVKLMVPFFEVGTSFGVGTNFEVGTSIEVGTSFEVGNIFKVSTSF